MNKQPAGMVASTRFNFLPLRRLQLARNDDFSVYKPATFVQRWYALTLDLALSGPLDVLINLPFNRRLEKLAAFGHSGRYWALEAFLIAAPILLYFVIPTFMYGQTLGKRIVGLKVVRADWQPQIGLTDVLLRETVGKLLGVGLFGLGIFMVQFNSRRRALHDYLGDSAVVSYREE